SAVCRLTPLQPEDVADLKLAVTEAATGLVREDSSDQLACDFSLGEDRLGDQVQGPQRGAVAAQGPEVRPAVIRAPGDGWEVDECEFADGAVTLVKYLSEPEQ